MTSWRIAENMFARYHVALLLEKKILEVREENERLKKRYLELKEMCEDL